MLCGMQILQKPSVPSGPVTLNLIAMLSDSYSNANTEELLMQIANSKS